ncbi:MAG TPA: lipid II flippase MurJ [Acidimicrobiales bacterium]|nr:lipid II flippase MurJ [Acidimicrobiales bacterium]
MSAPESVLRNVGVIGAWNAVSRVTGFVRALAVAGALGATFLGNTYQSANLLSTVLFEVLAAGLLSAPLVPVVVGLLASEREDDANRLLGDLLGTALAALGVLVVAGAAAGPWIMRALTTGVAPAGRDDQIRLGSFLLWFFLPQLLLYATGAIATAWLTARRRFAAAAAAPVANNIVVVATMLLFMATRPGGRPNLDLPLVPRLVLALGTSAGVFALAAVPWMAARRVGLRVRLRVAPRDAGVRQVARRAGWAAALVAAHQVLAAVTLVLANRVEGGVVAYQLGFTFFLLPFALLAHPIMTAQFPSLSARAHAGDTAGFVDELGRGLRIVAIVTLPAGALLAALSGPLLQTVRLGQLDRAGAGLVAPVLSAYAVGLTGFALAMFMGRAFAALGDTRTPGVVAAWTTAAGVAAMVTAAAALEGRGLVVGLGLVHSTVAVAGAVWLYVRLRARMGVPVPLVATTGRGLVAAGAAAAAAAGVASAVRTPSRAGEALALAGGGVVGVSVALATARLLHEPEVVSLGHALRGGRR